jgi:hypothetical protein
MYTTFCHRIAAYACVVIEAGIVSGFLRKLIFMLSGQVRVSASNVPNSSSAKVSGANA